MMNALRSVQAWFTANPWQATIIVVVVIAAIVWGAWFDGLASLRATLDDVGIGHRQESVR